MITTDNYFSKTKDIDWSSVPASLKKMHDTLIPDASRNDWQAFKVDDDIRRVVEKYFGYIGKYAGSSASQTSVSLAPAVQPDSVSVTQARAAVVEFLRPYVERGETVEQINKSYLGTSNAKGSFQVKSNKVLVDRIGIESVNYSFPLRSIFNEIGGDSAASKRPRKPAKSSSRKAASVEALPEPTQVVHIPTATVFIKRYVALHGKVKTRDQIISLLHGLQKAITEQRIRAAHPATREIEKMQSGLIDLAHNMGESVKIEIDEPQLSHYRQVAQGEAVRTSVKLLKQFIQLNGKRPDKVKAQKLGAKLLKAFDETPKEDAYRAELTAAAKAIGRYVKGDSATVDIPVATLHGLGSIAIGSVAGGLGDVGNQQNVLALANQTVGIKRDAASLKRAFRNTANPSLCYDLASAMLRRNSVAQKYVGQPRSAAGDHDGGIAGLDLIDWKLSNAQDVQISGLGSAIDEPIITAPMAKSKPPVAIAQTPVRPVTAQDLARMQFKTIGYNGRFKDVVGDPAIGFHMMVYGKPFQGKSSFVIELCKDLAALNKGRIAYLALEEGISASMQKKVIDRGAASALSS